MFASLANVRKFGAMASSVRKCGINGVNGVNGINGVKCFWRQVCGAIASSVCGASVCGAIVALCRQVLALCVLLCVWRKSVFALLIYVAMALCVAQVWRYVAP
jgi:hypothetical protein